MNGGSQGGREREGWREGGGEREREREKLRGRERGEGTSGFFSLIHPHENVSLLISELLAASLHFGMLTHQT